LSCELCNPISGMSIKGLDMTFQRTHTEKEGTQVFVGFSFEKNYILTSMLTNQCTGGYVLTPVTANMGVFEFGCQGVCFSRSLGMERAPSCKFVA